MGLKLDTIQTPQKKRGGETGGLEKWLKTEIRFSKGISSKKKQAFYLELSVLLKAGIPLKEALHLIIQNLKKENDRVLFEKILEDVLAGRSFSEAMETSHKFTEYEFFSLRIGEETGTSARVAEQLALFFERKNEQRRMVISALTYPAIVMTTAVLVILFMLGFVVPMFQDIFRQNNMELPGVTRVIIFLSDLLKSYGLVIVGMIAVTGMISGILIRRNEKFRALRDLLFGRIPIFGRFIVKVHLAGFTQAVALLTASKVPLLNSIRLVKQMIRFTPLQTALEGVEQAILKGDSLSKAMAKYPIFDSRMLSLIKVAEETNQTEFVFQQLNEQYNAEVARQSKALSTVLEPLIILIVGAIVGFLLIAMYLPMFQLSTAIG